MGIYGHGTYGTALYGSSAPASSLFDVFDFCNPTEATMLTLFSYPGMTGIRATAPYGQFVGNDWCLYSNDGGESGILFETDVPTGEYTLQFSVLPTQLPDDFSSLATNRFFVGVYNDGGKAIGLLLSENGGIALATDPENPISVFPDSADIFDEGVTYYVFRVTVDEGTGEALLYVTRKDVLAITGVHEHRYTFTAPTSPAGLDDHVTVSAYGTAADLTAVCLDCLRLSSSLLPGDQRPVAVISDPDISRRVGSFGYFDGRSSYDPDSPPQPLTYVWTLTSAPDESGEWITGSATSPVDASGYTNRLSGAAGTFSAVTVGDLIIGGLITAPVAYINDDSSELVCARDIFGANATVAWKVLKQSSWGGTWLPGVVNEVLAAQTTPPGGPSTGDAYLVTSVAIGAWVGHEGEIATWNGTAWTFYTPSAGYLVYSSGDYEFYRYAGSALWYVVDPRPDELDHWEGRVRSIGALMPDVGGVYDIDLIVHDGVRQSEPTVGVLSAQVLDSELGVTPDMEFIWSHLPQEYWDQIEGKEVFETFWSTLAQLASGDLLELWQHQIAGNLFRMQRTFQAHWLNYDLKVTIPAYSTAPADIVNTVNVAGVSAAPNVTPAGATSQTAYAYALDDGGLTNLDAVTDGHYLVLKGVAYRILRTFVDATLGSNVIVTEHAMPTGTDRSGYWMIRPTAISGTVDFGALRVTAFDTAVFEVRGADGSSEDVEAYIYGVRDGVLVFDDAGIATELADSTYTVLLKFVLRRSQMAVNYLTMTVPRLQESVNLGTDDAVPPLNEGRDYRLETVNPRVITFLDVWFEEQDRGLTGDYSAANVFEDTSATFTTTLGAVGTDLSDHLLEFSDERFRLSQVLSDTQLELKDSVLDIADAGTWRVLKITDPVAQLWAEITHFDNTPVIERGYGSLIGFGLDALADRTDDLDYLSAVQGLWYYVWNGRTNNNTRIAAQVILGLPFAEETGTVLDVREYDLARTQVLVRDDRDTTIIRSYVFPTVVGLDTNPDTGAVYTEGDTIQKFAPVCLGVDVQDYLSDEDWWLLFAGSGNFYEPQKLSNFGIQVSADVFDITNLEFLADWLREHRVRHRDAFFSVLLTIGEDNDGDAVDIEDGLLIGPVVPDGFTYPDTWDALGVVFPWADSPFEVTRMALTAYDPADDTTWATDPPLPVTRVALEVFGGLHLHDVAGRAPVGWEGAWPNGWGFESHDAAISEGDFRLKSYDPKGRPLHTVGAHLNAVNELSDGDFESGDDPGAGSSPWDVVGTPATCTKVHAGPVHGGAKSVHIVSTAGFEGIEQGVVDFDRDFQAGARVWIYVASGQAEISLVDATGAVTLDIVKCASGHFTGQWVEVTVHAFELDDEGVASPTATQLVADIPPAPALRDVKLLIRAGPAGGDFYVDDAGLYQKLMPWSQHGTGAHFCHRTGGHRLFQHKGGTPGGLPDEDLQTLIAIDHAVGIPKIGQGWVIGASSARDRQRTAGPAVDVPPADWSVPGVSTTPWYGPDYGPFIETWDAAGGYTGYGPVPNAALKIGVSLPAGWYTRIVDLLRR